MMRILVISNCPLEPNQGSGYVICGYAEEMRLRGHEVEMHDPENFTWLPYFYRAKRLRLLIGYTWKALWRSWRSRPDIVELWGGTGWLACALLSFFPRRKFILVSRSNGLEPHFRFVLQRKVLFNISHVKSTEMPSCLEEIGFKRCDVLTLVSHFDEQFAKFRKYQDAKRLLTLENPLPNEWLGLNVNFSRDSVVGFVGSWIERKGANILPDVIREVLSTLPNTRFLLIGVGSKAAQQLRQDFPDQTKVEIIPFCPRSELGSHYKRMSLLLAPSQYESFGLTFAEAMACGTLVLAPPIGFAAALVDQEEFIAIPELSSAAVTAIICKILGNEQARQRISQSGYQRVQSLCWQTAAHRLEEKYNILREERIEKVASDTATSV
jgi:glycosyltransferase involved in cell wall biosynthesis